MRSDRIIFISSSIHSAVMEATSMIGNDTATPLPVDPLPESVRGVVLAVEAYERTEIEAALNGSERDLRKAILLSRRWRVGESSAAMLKLLEWKA
ncbi:MAG: hypothetical protein V4734_10710 [Terriglobus sp.]